VTRSTDIRLGLITLRFWQTGWLLLFVLSGISCSIVTRSEPGRVELFQASPNDDHTIDAFVPVFLVQEADKSYNRIGMPQVRVDASGGLTVHVDPSQAALFVGRQDFRTTKGQYCNLIFRVHFEKVPFSFSEWHLGAGNNTGLIVVVTLNRDNKAVLVTTVHTCGCYLAFIPTDTLPPESRPGNWPKQNHRIYGKTLPAVIGTPKDGESSRILIVIAGGSHRVSEVKLVDLENIMAHYPLNEMETLPNESLWALPFGDQRISFFELSGRRKGYVKNNAKPLERLLMSWWTFDWYIGEDKVYGNSVETGVLFYTSLKFWRRRESDMWHFGDFLKYWGWRL
jgi:hypothetical protein